MELFGVGIGEAGLVLLITLLVVGPERFPQIAREGGKYYRMARRFTAEVTGDLRVAMKELETEVNEQAGDLKAVREIGEDVRSGVASSASDMDSISRATAEAASGATTSGPTASGATVPGPASPEARRETEVEPARADASSAVVASSVDPFARVRAVYADYHQPPPPAHGAAAVVEAAAQVPPEVDGDELSRQATEAFAEFHKPAESSVPAEPPAVPVPYSPQQIVGVNPFASADPPAPSRPGPTEDDDETDDAEATAQLESADTKAQQQPSSTPASGV